MSNKTNKESPLVRSVLALDNYLSELERVGAKINSTDLTSDFDLEYIHKLMTRFAECGKGVSEEVTNLSTQLHEAQARAQAVAQGVAAQAELFNTRKNEQNEKLEKFRILGDKVRELNAAIRQFRPTLGSPLTAEDRANLKSNVAALEGQLVALIGEAQELQKSAGNARMRVLQKNAESLGQSLQAVHKKLREIAP